MHILIVGLNHKAAPVEIREKVAIPDDTLAGALDQLVNHHDHQNSYVPEGVILSTCNRLEVCALVRDSSFGRRDICRFLSDFHGIVPEAFQDYLYTHSDEQAVRHLFAVASGIDSMVVGESQIQGQVRQAFEAAAQQGATGNVLSALFRQAINVGKRARAKTAIGRNAVSVSHAAVELARRIFGDLAGHEVLVIGAGETSELVARNLMDNGTQGIMVANRTYERAVELAERFGGRALRFDRLVWALRAADIVISSTAAPRFIISPDVIRQARRTRHGRPLFLIDIAVPRDIDPAVQGIDNVFLYDIDDLEAVVQANIRERQKEVVKVEAIIAQETPKFMGWFRSLDAVPTIVDLRAHAESIRQAELEKALRRLHDLSDRDQNIVRALSVGIVNKILHQPTVRLKQQAKDPNGYLYSDTLRHLFGLEEREE